MMLQPLAKKFVVHNWKYIYLSLLYAYVFGWLHGCALYYWQGDPTLVNVMRFVPMILINPKDAKILKKQLFSCFAPLFNRKRSILSHFKARTQ